MSITVIFLKNKNKNFMLKSIILNKTSPVEPYGKCIKGSGKKNFLARKESFP